MSWPLALAISAGDLAAFLIGYYLGTRIGRR